MKHYRRVSNHLYHYRFPVLLVLIGLVWISVFNYFTQVGSQEFIYPDSASYLEAAKNLYVYKRGHNYRPMLIAFIHGIPYLFGSGDRSVFIYGVALNIISWLLFISLLYQVLRYYVRQLPAFLISTSTIFVLGISALAFHLLTENIFMLFVLVAIYFLLKYIKSKRYVWLSASVSVVLLTTLIKPGMLFFALFYLMYFIRPLLKNARSGKTVLIYSSMMLLVVQCVGLRHQFGNFTISYIDAVTYYNYLGQKANQLAAEKKLRNRNIEIYSLPCPDQKKLAAADLVVQLQENPGNLLKAYLQNLLENATTKSLAISDSKNVKSRTMFLGKEFADASRMQNIILSVLTFLLAFWCFVRRFQQDSLAFLVSAFILYTILTSGISFGQGDRFNVITFPFALILLGITLRNKVVVEV